MSKDLFLQMREAEVLTDKFLPTKKELINSSVQLVNQIVESGEYNLMKSLLKLKD